MKDSIYYWLLSLHSPLHVWQFQKWFGVDQSFQKPRNKSAISENGFKSETREICNGVAENEHDCTKRLHFQQHAWSNFWYCFFKIGSFLGQEEFYIVFFPFWFWHFDSPTGRKSMLIWMICMHVGQMLKDCFRWPRPKSPPVVHLENTFLSEFGMPSTHATVAICVPFCMMYFMKDVCQISLLTVCAFVVGWCCWVSLSRIYMGVHTYLEILVGLSISACATSTLIPIIDDLDDIFMRTFWSPLILFISAFFLSFFYPNTKGTFTRSWSDAIAILSSCSGILCGSWLQSHFLKNDVQQFCIFSIHLHFSVFSFIRVFAKTVFGVGTILTAKIVAQHFFDIVFSKFSFAKDKQNGDTNKFSLNFQVTRKYFSYVSLGFFVFFNPIISYAIHNFY